jgi:hypothetical protein
MAVFNFLETFFFISLGITFVLILSMVYHFKERLIAVEQSSYSLLDIINNLVVEINATKKSEQQKSEQHMRNLEKIRVDYNNKNSIPEQSAVNIYPVFEYDEYGTCADKRESFEDSGSKGYKILNRKNNNDMRQLDEDEDEDEDEPDSDSDSDSDSEAESIFYTGEEYEDFESNSLTCNDGDKGFESSDSPLGGIDDVHVILTNIDKIGEYGVPIHTVEKILVPDNVFEITEDIIMDESDSDIRDSSFIEVSHNIEPTFTTVDTLDDTISPKIEVLDGNDIEYEKDNLSISDDKVRFLKEKYRKTAISELRQLMVLYNSNEDSSKMKKHEIVDYLISTITQDKNF